MTFECFKDWVFDVLNHAEDDVIADMALDDRQTLLRIRTVDGNRFEIECRKAGRIRKAVRRGKRKSAGNDKIIGNRKTAGQKALEWWEILLRGMFNNKRRASSKAKAGRG